jgi:hypothetical protein
LARGLCVYATVGECEAQVFTLFGKVIGTIDQPACGSRGPISAPRPADPVVRKAIR